MARYYQYVALLQGRDRKNSCIPSTSVDYFCDIEKRTILHNSMEEQRYSIEENSPALEGLKSCLRVLSPQKGKRQYKYFWAPWGTSAITVKEYNERAMSNSSSRYGVCCFIDLIGRPKKGEQDMPLLPYQRLIHQTLHERKQIWIKKSRGIGVTTFFLYWIACCCPETQKLKVSHMRKRKDECQIY